MMEIRKGVLTAIILTYAIQLAFSQGKMIIEQSFCDSSNIDPFDLRERIIKKEIRKDSLIVILGKREICCGTFKGDYKIESDTLKIKYENIGEQCFCICFYELTFKISKMKRGPIPITFNGILFEQSNRKSSNYETRMDTLRNGNILWTEYENNELISEIEDQDSVKIYRKYYKGKLRSVNKFNKSK
jgi:hypothetical protein